MIVEIVPHDDGWAEAFERERQVLERALRPWLRGGIHHVGSTAVPGLAAKPILDVVAGVADLARASAAVPVLEGLGFAQGVHRPDEALWFAAPAGAPEARRTCQLHLTEVGSPLWRERLAFRDALRADPVLRAEYASLKQHLAATVLDPRAYAAGKRELVRSVLARSGLVLREDRPAGPA